MRLNINLWKAIFNSCNLIFRLGYSLLATFELLTVLDFLKFLDGQAVHFYIPRVL